MKIFYSQFLQQKHKAAIQRSFPQNTDIENDETTKATLQRDKEETTTLRVYNTNSAADPRCHTSVDMANIPLPLHLSRLTVMHQEVTQIKRNNNLWINSNSTKLNVDTLHDVAILTIQDFIPSKFFNFNLTQDELLDKQYTNRDHLMESICHPDIMPYNLGSLIYGGRSIIFIEDLEPASTLELKRFGHFIFSLHMRTSLACSNADSQECLSNLIRTEYNNIKSQHFKEIYSVTFEDSSWFDLISKAIQYKQQPQ